MSEQSPIAAYREATRQREVAEAEAQNLISRVVQGATLLQGEKWRSAQISNDPTGKSWPLEAVGWRASIDGKRWPDATVLATVLHNYHDARTAERAAYNQIPSDDREVVRSPD